MKDINTPTEVVEKIKALIEELHDVCIKNGVPLVIAALVGRRATTRGELIDRLFSVHLDIPADVTDSSILAASEVLRMRAVPEAFITELEMIRKMMESAETCNCPECQADRARKH